MNATTENINFFVAVLSTNSFSVVEIHSLLVNASGDVKSLRRIQDIAKEYKRNEREGATRKEGSGRPSTTTTEEKVAEVKQLLDEDSNLSIRGIATLAEVTVNAAYRIMTEKLKMKCVYARWIPHQLTENHKTQRVEEAQHLLQNLNGYTMVVDEKWVYSDPLPCRQNNASWVAPDGDRPTIARRIISDQKFHIIVACNFRGDFRFKVFERNQTINAERYVEFLQTIQNTVRTGRLHLMHDNARPHTAVMTQTFCEQNRITLVKQPPYSPDMNLLDRFVFRNLEFDRRAVHFPNKDALTLYLQNFLENKMTRFKLARELDRLKHHLQEVIDIHGNYV
jgi:[histone H3]-lysine36 N-dimethyltransferase SETMAR